MNIPTLQDKRIVITGGARGLGRAFSEAALRSGARVIIGDKLEGRGRETAADLSQIGEIYFELIDIGCVESVDAFALRVQDCFGGVDGIVNCAAIATGIGGRLAEEIDVETWDRVMTVNVRGTWLVTKAFIPSLRATTNGKIVNVASDTAMWGAPRLLHYVTSKGAIISMTRALARELGNDGISVNVIAPGLTLVEATDYVPEERHRQYVDGRAMNRAQRPEDITGTVLYLLSDAADFVTGQLLPVNGGFVFN